MRKSVCIIEMGLLLFFALVFSAATGLERQQQRISDSMIRLHVVANSDNPGDQAIKFNVRDAVLSDAQELLQHTTSRDEAMNVLTSGLPQLTETANETLRQLGASDRATVTLKRELFGTRYYDTFTLPGGYYEALRVTIGEGDGKNWWCVVYPQLCLSARSSTWFPPWAVFQRTTRSCWRTENSASGSGALSCWKTCWDIFGTPAMESPLPNKVELWYNNGTLKRK